MDELAWIGGTAFGLGAVFSLSAYQALSGVLAGSWPSWWVYLSCLSCFHFLEFMTTARYQPQKCSFDSFLLNHSVDYLAAMLASWAEYGLELWLLPSVKGWTAISVAGFAVVVVGQSLRTAAMITAGSNFTHQISERKAAAHALVTHGVYTHLRHPSYTGWFWWSIATQLLLLNPLCLVAYAVASWNFFRLRIPYEEQLLVKFFPDEYPAYRARTHVFIPFLGRSAARA